MFGIFQDTKVYLNTNPQKQIKENTWLRMCAHKEMKKIIVVGFMKIYHHCFFFVIKLSKLNNKLFVFQTCCILDAKLYSITFCIGQLVDQTYIVVEILTFILT